MVSSEQFNHHVPRFGAKGKWMEIYCELPKAKAGAVPWHGPLSRGRRKGKGSFLPGSPREVRLVVSPDRHPVFADFLLGGYPCSGPRLVDAVPNFLTLHYI